MKKYLRDIAPHQHLYRDDKTGIAWIHDGRSGVVYSIHPYIDKSGSVKGMKHQKFWNQNDRCIKTNGSIFNIDMICVSDDIRYTVLKNECLCLACCEMRA